MGWPKKEKKGKKEEECTHTNRKKIKIDSFAQSIPRRVKMKTLGEGPRLRDKRSLTITHVCSRAHFMVVTGIIIIILAVPVACGDSQAMDGT